MATKGDISGLDVLMYGGVPLIPLLNSYSGHRKSGLVQSNTLGGATKQRKKFYGTTYTYDASFFLDNKLMQDYVKSFFELNEGKKFICHLKADRPIVEPYVVQVTSDWEDPYCSEVDGKLTVTLEIFQARDRGMDEFLNYLYSNLGDETNQWVFDVSEIVLELP